MSLSRRTAPSRGAVDRRGSARWQSWVGVGGRRAVRESRRVRGERRQRVASSGGANTANVGGVLYDRTGALLTLSITTSSDAQCVELDDARGRRADLEPRARRPGATASTAPSGSGVKTVKVKATPKQRQRRGRLLRVLQGDRQVSFALEQLPVRCWPGPPRRRPTPRAGTTHGRHGRLDGRRRRLGRRLRPDARDRQRRRRTRPAGCEDVDRDRQRRQHRQRLGRRQGRQGARRRSSAAAAPAPNANGWNNTDVDRRLHLHATRCRASRAARAAGRCRLDRGRQPVRAPVPPIDNGRQHARRPRSAASRSTRSRRR